MYAKDSNTVTMHTDQKRALPVSPVFGEEDEPEEDCLYTTEIERFDVTFSNEYLPLVNEEEAPSTLTESSV